VAVLVVEVVAVVQVVVAALALAAAVAVEVVRFLGDPQLRVAMAAAAALKLDQIV
jgi:hypothetical protein